MSKTYLRLFLYLETPHEYTGRGIRNKISTTFVTCSMQFREMRGHVPLNSSQSDHERS